MEREASTILHVIVVSNINVVHRLLDGGVVAEGPFYNVVAVSMCKSCFRSLSQR